MTTTRIVIIEDDGRYRETLATLIECTDGLELVDAFADAVQAVGHAQRLA